MTEAVKKAATKKATAKKTTKPAADKAPVEKKATAEKADDGRITLATLCEELDMNPAAARRKLRAAEIERPEGQAWSWKPGRELDKVRKTLTAE